MCVMICVGAPPTPSQIMAFSLIGGRKSLAGSLIGGLLETQEMLDYCAEHNIVSECRSDCHGLCKHRLRTHVSRGCEIPFCD